MISLTVTGHAEPEQPREEIARLLKEYGVGAVCLLRDGRVKAVQNVRGSPRLSYGLGEDFKFRHCAYGLAWDTSNDDIIRVWPKDTRLRIAVEVVE